MRFIIVLALLASIMLLSCGESKEKPRPEYRIENLKFGFADVLENVPAFELSDYSGRWLELERLQYTETTTDNGSKTIGRMAFINEGKLNGLPSLSHCASDGEGSDLKSAVNFQLPFNLQLINSDVLRAEFFAPTEFTFSVSGRECAMISTKSTEFNTSHFLYGDISGKKIDQRIQRGSSSVNSQKSWQFSVSRGKVIIITEEKFGDLTRMTMAVYRVGSKNYSEFSTWKDTEYKIADSSDLVLETDSDGIKPGVQSEGNTGTVNISIPESWFN